ncbi:MAG: choice-of-anchor B family protein [Saprospiraceae bacterium]
MLKKQLPVFVFFTLQMMTIQAQQAWNLSLFGQVNRGDARYSGSWAYIDSTGKEYALIGAKTGTAAYCIDSPDSLDELGFVPGPVTNWREITTIGHFAYVVTDVQGTGHGMQVIDLEYLPDSLHLVTTYNATFTTGHIIQKAIDSDEPIVYVMGTTTTQGVHILDVSDPAQPVEIGVYAPGYYIHDSHIRGNLLFGAAFYKKELDIVDISDKTNPTLIGKVTYSGTNTHSSSSTEDGKYLLIADEADGYPARIFNIEDIGNPVEVAQYSANEESLVHNPYIKGDLCFLSHNTEGIRVLDIADPTLPVEVGYYDTWNGPSGGFHGLWSACPYFPSGKIIGGNRTDGLYIWAFNGTRAARFYGAVTDSLSGTPLAGAQVVLTAISDTLALTSQGHFKKGLLPGSYTIEVWNEGYLPKVVELPLAQGDSLWLDIQLVPEDFTATSTLPNKLPELIVYPNPITNEAFIDLSQLPAVSTLSLYDSSGKHMQTIATRSRWQITFKKNSIPPGVYYFEATGKGGAAVASAAVIIR